MTKDYIVEGGYAEEIIKNKLTAINRAKQLAKKHNEPVTVIPCIDSVPIDNVTHYSVEPNGIIKEIN